MLAQESAIRLQGPRLGGRSLCKHKIGDPIAGPRVWRRRSHASTRLAIRLQGPRVRRRRELMRAQDFAIRLQGPRVRRRRDVQAQDHTIRLQGPRVRRRRSFASTRFIDPNARTPRVEEEGPTVNMGRYRVCAGIPLEDDSFAMSADLPSAAS